MAEPPKKRRQQRPKDDFGSPTKQKGAAVVGRQASTLFGQPGAPKPGVTSEQRRNTIRAAELAAKLSVDILEEVDTRVTELKKAGQSSEVIATMTTNVLNLMRDAMDREFGKASASLDVTSSDGSAQLPTVIRLVGPDTPEDG